jgi:copper(I)-binding protein
MRRPQNKNLFVAITTAALALSLTACSGAGPNAATRLIKQVTDGAEIKIDKSESKISVTNLLLVPTEDGSAVVVGTIINRGTTKDSLVGISVGNVPAALTGEVKLALNEPIRFEGEQATTKAVFNAVGAQAGHNIPITLSFERAGNVTTNVIIRDKRDAYANVNK